MVRKKGLQFLSLVLSFLILASLLIPPVWANEVEYVQESTFWHWLNKQGGIFNGIVAYGLGKACPESPDGYHRSASTMGEGMLWKDDQYQCVCDYCHQHFWAVESDIKQSYDNYVETLPASGYTSAGGLMWQPTLSDLDLKTSSLGYYFSKDRRHWNYCSGIPFTVVSDICSFSVDADTASNTYCCSFSNVSYFRVNPRFAFQVPISGSYRRTANLLLSYRALRTDGQILSGSCDYEVGSFVHVSSGASVSAGDVYSPSETDSFSNVSLTLYLPVFEVIPDTALSADTYNINTRPTSITGGNYGIVGDNGQITKVEDNSTIINETNNTFYNPATGSTVPIVNWSYDYSDRSYKVTLESGDTATITYGDENITISQITTTEGDTITNNYTIYYLVDGSGSTTPPCDHAWTETNTTPATCTVPGSKLSTCSKCQQTKKDPIPALGHDWQVKQTVTTEYDDTGQLTQEGYTIFECSRCHEQYKSPDGTIPPGGGSGTDPGDEEETIWDKLGKLLGTAVKALLDLLGSAVDVILGGLIDLITNLVESLKQLVDLFGTVGEAFQVLWTWLPPEITAILVAGVSIFVFVALLKFFMK